MIKIKDILNDGVLDKIRSVSDKIGLTTSKEDQEVYDKVFPEIKKFINAGKSNNPQNLYKFLEEIFIKYNVPKNLYQNIVNGSFQLRGSYNIEMRGGHRPYLR